MCHFQAFFLIPLKKNVIWLNAAKVFRGFRGSSRCRQAQGSYLCQFGLLYRREKEWPGAAASGRRGQGGRPSVQPGGTVIAPGLTRRRARAPPSISIHLAAAPDQAGGRAWASAPNNENNCLPAWHCPYLLPAPCPLLPLTLLVPRPRRPHWMGSELGTRWAPSAARRAGRPGRRPGCAHAGPARVRAPCRLLQARGSAARPRFPNPGPSGSASRSFHQRWGPVKILPL